MKILILLKARLKENLFTTSYLKDLYQRDRLWLLPLAGAGILAAAGFMVLMLFQNYRGILAAGLETGNPQMVILFASVVSGILIFFIGTPLCLSNIYYSKDNILVAPLPVTSADIVLSRVLSVYLFTLPVHLLVVIPALAVYLPAATAAATAAASPAVTVFSTIVFCLTGSVIPLALSLAASAALAGLGIFSGSRTAFEIIGMIAAIVFAAAVQLAAGRSLMSSGDLSQISAALTGYVDTLERIFFVSRWTANGFAGGAGAAEGIVSTLLSLAAPALAVIAAAQILMRTKLHLAAVEGTGRTRQNRNPSRSGIPAAGRSSAAALIKREWIVVRSNSAFLMEVIGEVVILPILLAVFYFAMPDDIMSFIYEMTEGITFLPLIVFGMLVLMSAINSVSSTSLSREGATFAVSKYIPVSGSAQVAAKMYFHMLLFTASWMLNLAILMLILRIPPVHLLYLLPAGPAVTALGFAATIHIDLTRPVLNWTHPQQAMKQNMNVLIGMGFGFLTAAAVIAPAAGLFLAGLSQPAAGLLVTAAATAADFILIRHILRRADSRYMEISC